MNKKYLTILIGIIAVATIGFFVMRNKTDNTPAITSTETPQQIEGWQTYRNEELGFEVQYPEGWEFDWDGYSTVSFGPGGLDGYQRRFSKVWYVSVYSISELNNTSFTQDINLLKKDSIEQYAESERRISDESKLFKSIIARKFIFIDGHKSVLAKEAVPEFENWVLESVFTEKNGEVFTLSDVSNAYASYEALYGAPLVEKFQDFYESFHFID